jgi:pyruvate,water dikinase
MAVAAARVGSRTVPNLGLVRAARAGRIAHKGRECRPAPEGRGVVTVDVPPERRDVAALEDEQVRALAALAMRVEEHYGCPQDIEWALDASGRLLILQSRPETTWRSVRAARPSGGSAFLDLVHAIGARPERG